MIRAGMLTMAVVVWVVPAYALKADWTPASLCKEAASDTLQPAVPPGARRSILSACEEAMRDGATRKACDQVAMKAPKDKRLAIAYTCYTAADINAKSR